MLFHHKCNHEYVKIDKLDAPGYVRSFGDNIEYFKCSKCNHCVAIDEYNYNLKKMLTAY